MNEPDWKPLIELSENMAGKAKRFATTEEVIALETSVAEMRSALDRFTLSKGRLFSICRGIEARLSKGEPELNDIITSGPVS